MHAHPSGLAGILMYGAEADFDKRLQELAPAHPNVVVESPVSPEVRPLTPPTYTAGGQKPKDKFRGVFSEGFFMMPNRLFGSGLGAKLGGSAGWIYTALCDHANRNGNRTFKVSDLALASDTGLSTRTIIGTRKKLIKFGLIECSILPGRSAVYTLKNLPLEWIPVKQRPRSKYKPRGKSAAKFAHPEETEPIELPQFLRGTNANFARPYKFFNKG